MYENMTDKFAVRKNKDPHGWGYSETAGFLVDGKFTGFVWIVEDYVDADHHRLFICGIVMPYSDRYEFGCLYDDDLRNKVNVRYLGEAERFYKELRLECDDMKRIVFCGQFADSERCGLGSEFSYDSFGNITEFQGLWERGILTHRREGDRLVPVTPEEAAVHRFDPEKCTLTESPVSE